MLAQPPNDIPGTSTSECSVTQNMLADCIRIVVGIFPNFFQHANSLNSKTENNYQNNLLKYNLYIRLGSTSGCMKNDYFF